MILAQTSHLAEAPKVANRSLFLGTIREVVKTKEPYCAFSDCFGLGDIS